MAALLYMLATPASSGRPSTQDKKSSEMTSCPIIIRYSMAAIVNATNQFKNIFNSSGYLLIMPSLVQVPIVLLHHHHEFKRSVNPQQVSLLVQIFRLLIRSGCLCCRSYTRQPMRILIVLQIYSNNLSNLLVSSSIEFLVKQLYVLHRFPLGCWKHLFLQYFPFLLFAFFALHRKPFLLQMFGSIANSLDVSRLGTLIIITIITVTIIMIIDITIIGC